MTSSCWEFREREQHALMVDLLRQAELTNTCFVLAERTSTLAIRKAVPSERRGGELVPEP